MPLGINDSVVRSALLAPQPSEVFLGFLEAAPDAVVIIEGNGTIVRINRQAERLFGYAREELVGRLIECLMPERFRASHVPLRQAFAVNPEARNMGQGLDLFGLRKDGREFPIDVSLSPLPTESGLLMVGAIRDMSAHRHLEDELRQRTLALEKADREKDQFLAAVAHELRSPLAVLSNVVYILNSSRVGPAAHQRAVEMLARQSAHMARLVEDLLDVSRVRRGTVALHLERIDLCMLLPRAVEMAQPLIEARAHLLEVAPCGEPLWVLGDASRLTQVLTNLLTNAAKFTPERGHIRLSAAREDEMVVIRIRDDGMGIPKEMLSQVFDLFTQAEPAELGNTGGLGIGLALVRSLVDLHEGTVDVTSDGPGRGSEFVVRLPALTDRLPTTSKAHVTPIV